MRLAELPKITKAGKRVGRGIGSRGAKSGRGMKGQKARAGYSRKAGFEGGQTPLYMRLPKGRGTKQVFASQKVRPAIVRVDQLDRFDDGSIVGIGVLREAGLVTGRRERVKLIGARELARQVPARARVCKGTTKEQVEQQARGRGGVLGSPRWGKWFFSRTHSGR